MKLDVGRAITEAMRRNLEADRRRVHREYLWAHSRDQLGLCCSSCCKDGTDNARCG